MTDVLIDRPAHRVIARALREEEGDERTKSDEKGVDRTARP
jgi:hypothetical protein